MKQIIFKNYTFSTFDNYKDYFDIEDPKSGCTFIYNKKYPGIVDIIAINDYSEPTILPFIRNNPELRKKTSQRILEIIKAVNDFFDKEQANFIIEMLQLVYEKLNTTTSNNNIKKFMLENNLNPWG